MSNIVPITSEPDEPDIPGPNPNRLSFTLEEMLAEFENGAVPRSKYWKELITALYDTANHVVTGVTSVADVRPDNVGNIPLLPKDIDAPAMVRMDGADSNNQQTNQDVFGRSLFYGDACKVVHQYGAYYEVLAGTAYVAGIRFFYPGMQELLIEEVPNKVWVDVSWPSDAMENREPVIKIFSSNENQVDYIDENGIEHYLDKVALLSSSNDLIDSRKTQENISSIFETFQPVTHDNVLLAQADTNINRCYIKVGDNQKNYKKILESDSIPSDGFKDAGGNIWERIKETKNFVDSDALQKSQLLMFFGMDWSNNPLTGIQGVTLTPDNKFVFVSQNVRGESDQNNAPDESLNVAKYSIFTDGAEHEPEESTVGLLRTGHGQDLSMLYDGDDVYLFTQGTNPDDSIVNIENLKGEMVDIQFPNAGRQIARIKWNGANTTDSDVQLYKVLPDFNKDDFETYYYKITPSVSDDGKFLVGHTQNMRGRNFQRVYVWNLDAILNGNITPISFFNIPPSLGDGGLEYFAVQSIYCYNNVIYIVRGYVDPDGEKAVMAFSMNGELIYNSNISADTSGMTGTITKLEPEGVHISCIGINGFDDSMYMGFNVNTKTEAKYSLVEFGTGNVIGYKNKPTHQSSPGAVHFPGNSIDVTWNAGSFLFLGTWSSDGHYRSVFDIGENRISYRGSYFNIGYNGSFVGTFTDSDRYTLFLRTENTEANGGSISLYGNSDSSIAAGQVQLKSGNGVEIKLLDDRISFSHWLRPINDGIADLASASARMNELFAKNDAINTSDENEKLIDEIPGEWLNAAFNIHQIRFKWLDEIEAYKSGARNIPRWHIGYGAQSVYKVLVNAGIENPWELSFMCKDALEKELDDGSVLPIIDENTGLQKERWGLRIEELNTLKLAAIERKLAKLESK